MNQIESNRISWYSRISCTIFCPVLNSYQSTLFPTIQPNKTIKDHRSDQHKRNVIQFHGLPLETLTTLLVIVFSSSINYFTKYCQSVFLISRETYLLKRTISDKPKNEKTFNDIFMTFYIRLPWFIKVITHMRS